MKKIMLEVKCEHTDSINFTNLEALDFDELIEYLVDGGHDFKVIKKKEMK